MVVHLRQAHHQLERIASFCGHDHRLPLSFAPGISENSLTYCFQYFPVCPYYTPTNLVCQWDEMQVYKFFTENFHDMGCGFLGEYDDKKRTVLRTVRFFKSYSRSFRQQKFFRCLHHSLQCTIQLFLPQTGHSPVHSHGTQCTVVCITAQKMYPFFLDPAEHLMPPDGIFAKQCAAAELFIYRQCITLSHVFLPQRRRYRSTCARTIVTSFRSRINTLYFMTNNGYSELQNGREFYIAAIPIAQ